MSGSVNALSTMSSGMNRVYPTLEMLFMRSESSHVVSWRVAPVVDGVMMSVVKAIFSLFWLNL